MSENHPESRLFSAVTESQAVVFFFYTTGIVMITILP